MPIPKTRESAPYSYTSESLPFHEQVKRGPVTFEDYYQLSQRAKRISWSTALIPVAANSRALIPLERKLHAYSPVQIQVIDNDEEEKQPSNRDMQVSSLALAIIRTGSDN